jgi:hypothetical protein
LAAIMAPAPGPRAGEPGPKSQKNIGRITAPLAGLACER